MKTYLTNLITEKGRDVEDDILSLNEKGHFGITWTVLIDFIQSTDKAARDKVRDTLVAIDFKNGDVFHYLDFLAVGMISAWGYEVA